MNKLILFVAVLSVAVCAVVGLYGKPMCNGKLSLMGCLYTRHQFNRSAAMDDYYRQNAVRSFDRR